MMRKYDAWTKALSSLKEGAMSCAVHIVLRADYQTMVSNDISQQLSVPSPDGNGWKETKGELDILWHLKFCSPTLSQGKQFGKYYYVTYPTE